MKRKAVDSSVIQSIDYDAVKKILKVEFIGNKVYQYMDVPEMLYIQLMRASSKGNFFNTKIRDAGFEFTQLK